MQDTLKAMHPETLCNWKLDLLFRIDLDNLRPFNAYGMTASDFAERHRKYWEAYGFPEEYVYVHSYVRLDDLSRDFSSYINYVRDLFNSFSLGKSREREDIYSIEQAIGIIAENKIKLLICDETDLDRPWAKHFKLLELLCNSEKMVINYDHSVWGYRYSDDYVYVRENDELFDEDEKPLCCLIEKKELEKQVQRLKNNIRIHFKSLYPMIHLIIPDSKKDTIRHFFSYT